MSQVTSTKPSQKGTFGAETKQCVFDGSTMRKLPLGSEYNYDEFYCPTCGWLARFIKKEE